MLLALLLKIITLNEHIRDKVEHPEKSEENYEGIVRVLDYISQNYASDLKISDMAELSNIDMKILWSRLKTLRSASHFRFK